MCKYLPVFTAVFVLLVALCRPCHSTCSENEMFMEHPTDEQVMAGDTVTFSCIFAVPNTLWTWEFHQQGGKRFSISTNATHPDFRVGLSGELVVPSVQSNHTGDYQCHFRSDTNCNVFSYNASLTVISQPTLVVSTRGPLCYNSTETAVVTGDVIGHPLPFIHFYQLFEDNDMALVVNSRVNITQPTDDNIRFSITFDSLLTTDTGRYVVQANNSIGVSDPIVVDLTVKGPDLPEITLDSSPYLIQRFGARVPQVTCSIQHSANHDADPATLRWEGPNEFEMVESNVVELELPLESFENQEEGEYTCTATNVRGIAEHVSVYVYAPISLPNRPSVTDIGDDKFRVSWTEPGLPQGVPIHVYMVYIISRESDSTYKTHQTLDIEYVIDSATFEPGVYEVRVAVVLGDEDSAATGEGLTMTATTTISVSEPSPATPLSLLVIVGVVVAGVVILLLVGIFIGLFFLCYYYPHRRKLSSQQQSWSKENRLDETDQSMGNSYEPLHIPHTELPPSPAPHSSMVTQYFNTEVDIDPKWEFSRGNLKLSEVLCESHSTVLYKATAEGIRDKAIDVAVKALRDTATEDEAKVILYEMDQLSSLGDHPNLVSLLRVCTVEQPLCMVMEYMCHGDLLGFLRASRGHYGMYTVNPGIRNQQPPNLQLSSRDLLSLAGKVANGMRFLADRKIVHRALCCKNVLVGAGLEIKINNVGGFDLPDEVRSPLAKWFAPEVLNGENFSIGSDVWAFGVTLWEIITVGATPYAEMNSADLFSQLYSGYRMPRPPHCGQDIYDIMVHCWAYSSGDRPHFATIHERLDGLAHSKMSLLDLRSYNERAYSQFDECPSQATAL